MVSDPKTCSIAIAKELWEAIQPVLKKYGAEPTETKDVHGIMIFTFTTGRKGQCTMMGRCCASDAIRVLLKEAIHEGTAAVIPVG